MPALRRRLGNTIPLWRHIRAPPLKMNLGSLESHPDMHTELRTIRIAHLLSTRNKAGKESSDMYPYTYPPDATKI